MPPASQRKRKRSQSDVEYTFEPDNLSDITVHYGGASYHLHQLHLVGASEYFATIINQQNEATSCDLTERCERASHRCVTLDVDGSNTIGGQQVSHQQLNLFFRELYSHADGSGKWKELVKYDRPNTEEPPFCYFRILRSKDTVKDEVTWDCYEHDGVRELVITGEVDSHATKIAKDADPAAVDVKVSTTRAPKYFIYTYHNAHPHYHLAAYFHSDLLMKHYRLQAAAVIAMAATRSGHVSTPWQVINIADQYHWPEVREACIELCKKQLQFHKQPAKILLDRLTRNTLQDILLAVYE